MRRLAPDCSRVELASLPGVRDELALLRAMGWEIGNIHLGSPRAARGILADLRKRPRPGLRKAVETMSTAAMADWKDWKRR